MMSITSFFFVLQELHYNQLAYRRLRFLYFEPVALPTIDWLTIFPD